MRGSALTNEETTKVMTKASQTMLAPLTSPGYPIFLNLLLSSGVPLVEPLHLFLGWELLRAPWGLFCQALSWAGGGSSCAGAIGVLCAEEDKGVPAALSCVCSAGSCDHSSQIYLASVGSCFLLMQNNKNIIITKVQAQ